MGKALISAGLDGKASKRVIKGKTIWVDPAAMEDLTWAVDQESTTSVEDILCTDQLSITDGVLEFADPRKLTISQKFFNTGAALVLLIIVIGAVRQFIRGILIVWDWLF